jgi:hypothetical protein
MHLELTDEQTEALIRELSQVIDGDRFPLVAARCDAQTYQGEDPTGGPRRKQGDMDRQRATVDRRRLAGR